MAKELLSIKETADLLGVSIDTLRRWDNLGTLKAIRSGPTGHRYYKRIDIMRYGQDLSSLAQSWALNPIGSEPEKDFYCINSSIFQSKLTLFSKKLEENAPDIEATLVSLLPAIAGEIGNNSFDHNLGNWPDVPGILFAFDIPKRIVVLADRGQGILTTLKRVRPSLTTDSEALQIGFTEKITGRAPEDRGNGLKFVRKVVSQYPISLVFESGNGRLIMNKQEEDIHISENSYSFHGCLALIRF